MNVFSSVWVGDGNIATVADACITIRIMTQSAQQQAPEHKQQQISVATVKKRPKSGWRRWLSCKDVQVEEPLLTAPEHQVQAVQVTSSVILVPALHLIPRR